ncbi:hypothetical protein OEZ86_005635 [Tetradesmus obliquus]|nr:hypothetical protein OEZ86_005635 [Tetradesmus obliquus]
MSYGTRASGSSSAARGRRWSTGVAAHDLIARKQALMMPSPGSKLSRDLEGVGSSGPGSGVSSVRCRVSISSKGPDGSLASSLEELQQLIDAHVAPTAAAGAVAAGSAPWAAVGAAARAAPAGPSSYGGGAATATTNSAGLSRLGSASSLGGCSTMSSGSHQVVNILGMPPKPAAVLNQRRMSYDTATASYTLVSKLEQEQQVLAQQQLLLPQQQCLRAGQSHCSTAAAGTITHQAPEVLCSGHLSPAADIYAFGIMLWELLTGEHPFGGMLEGDLVVGVCDRKLRPVFPPGAPAAYVALAQQCWADDASERPTAAQLLKRLNELLYEWFQSFDD